MKKIKVLIKLLTDRGKKEADYDKYSPKEANLYVHDDEDIASNKRRIEFPKCKGGVSLIDHVDVFLPNGTVNRIELKNPITVSEKIMPIFDAGCLVVKTK